MCCSIIMYVHAWSMVRFSFGLNITPYQEVCATLKHNDNIPFLWCVLTKVYSMTHLIVIGRYLTRGLSRRPSGRVLASSAGFNQSPVKDRVIPKTL